MFLSFLSLSCLFPSSTQAMVLKGPRMFRAWRARHCAENVRKRTRDGLIIKAGKRSKKSYYFLCTLLSLSCLSFAPPFCPLQATTPSSHVSVSFKGEKIVCEPRLGLLSVFRLSRTTSIRHRGVARSSVAFVRLAFCFFGPFLTAIEA